MSAAETLPPPGNAPTINLAETLDPAKLQPWIDYQYAGHRERAVTLSGAFDRFLAATKGGITTDEVAGRAAEFVRQIRAESSATDTTRSTIKAPVLHAQRLIDGDAKKIVDRLSAMASTVEATAGEYLRAKAEAVRKAAIEEAQRSALAAHEALLAADALGTTGAAEEAVEAVQEARIAEAQANASLPDLSRTRHVSGAMMGLKDNWQYRVVDLSKVDPAYLTINDTMVKAAMKSAGKKIADLRIAGIEFYNSPVPFTR